jgi:hypothetical protein
MGAENRREYILLCLFLTGCLGGTGQARFLSDRQARFAPRGRIACLPTSTPGVRYPDPCNLGGHSYDFGLFERNGIVYTSRAGHIDITHLRKAADWTAHLAYQTRAALRANRTEFSFRVREPSKYHVRIEYPAGWQHLPADTRENIALEVSIRLGQYLAFTCCTWHEILTWFGFKGAGFYPEYESAFSWEDSYSNALGSRIGGRALRDPNHGFDEAMTLLIDHELRELGVQPRPAAYEAAEAVRNHWFTRGYYFKCYMLKRNLDIGLDDGFVTPWLVPGYPASDGVEPEPCPVPRLASLEDYGFAARVEIEPKEWERDQIFRVVYPEGTAGRDRIEPARHFGPLMERIQAQAVARYGPLVADSRAPSRPPPSPEPPSRLPLRQVSAQSSPAR